jgi:glycosyltransferase involved in cell wall biosynthesis
MVRRRRINVLHVADKFGVGGSSIHGVTRLFSWWFPEFDSSRYNVRLVGLRGLDASAEVLRAKGIDVTALDRGKLDPRTLWDLVRYIREHDVDILHLHGYGASNFGVLAARLTGARAIIHEHVVDPHIPGYQVVADFSLSRLADHGIAICHAVKDFMVERRHLPEAKVEVIYNGIPLAEFKPVPEARARAERERLGLAEDAKVVTTVGRIDEQKGIRYLVDALPEVLRHHPATRILIVGDGPLLDPLKERAAGLGVGDAVVFTGYHTDIPLIQSLTTLQVFPSLWEGTTLTVFEAMAMRLPIVATDVDGLGEVVEHEETALVVPPRDPSALAEAIVDLLDRPERADALASAAFSASKQFDNRATVRRLEAAYDALVSPGSSSGAR